MMMMMMSAGDYVFLCVLSTNCASHYIITCICRIRVSTLPPDEKEFGAEISDGNYTGLIGALQSQVTHTHTHTHRLVAQW